MGKISLSKMMNLSSKNPMIAEIFGDIISQEDDHAVIGNDYDGMNYRFELKAKEKKLLFSVAFDTYQEIYDICQDHRIKTYYSDLTLQKTPQEDFNFTLEIDLSKIKPLP